MTNPTGRAWSDYGEPVRITTFSLNVEGYSRSIGGTKCDGTESGAAGVRSLSGMDQIASRLAVTPTRYGSIPNWSWMRFQSNAASWPTADRYANTFSWYQLVFDSRKQFNKRFIGAFADGHAGKYGTEKFVKYYVDTPAQTEASTSAQWCTQMNNRNLWEFWGPSWKAE